MASPTSEEIPKKPKNLPKEAIWCVEDSEWVRGRRDEEGKYHGEIHYWRVDGTLCCVATLVNGIAAGAFKRFHENGDVSYIGTFVGGKLHGKGICIDCKDSTTEKMHPLDMDQRIWRSELTYNMGGIDAACFFLEDGREVDNDGQPLGPRPAGIPESALTSSDGWVSIVDENAPKQGKHVTRWLADGTLYQEEIRTEDGKCEELTTYEDGKIKEYSRYFPGEILQIRRNYYPNMSFEKVNDVAGRRIQESSWYSKDHAFDEEKLFFYEGEKLVKVREREAPGYVSYEATMQADGKMFCEFFSIDGLPTLSGYVEEGTVVGVWNLHTESASVDTTDMGISVNPKNSDLSFSIYTAFFEVSLPSLTASLDEDFLKNLDAIDWGNAESCYGSPESVRDGIIGQTSPLSCIRNSAMGWVLGETLHQGSLYEVTALAVPFLIALLEHPNADTDILLTQLRWYAEAAKPWAEEALIAKAELAEGDEDWTIGILGTLDAISTGWEKIVKFSDDPSLAAEVISLAKYGSKSAKAFLFECAKSEDPVKRAIAIDAISGFSEFEKNDLLSFLEDDSAVVRLVAALRTALYHERETPKPFVDELIKSADDYEELEEFYYQILSSDSDLLAEIAYALACVRSAQTQELLGWLCEHIDTVNGASATLYGQSLLMLALGRVGDPFADTFIQVMKTLATSKQFNLFNVNAREVLDMWLLPDDRELLDLAEEMEKNENPEVAMRTWLEAKMN